jgi:hypothetical protein
MTIEDKPTKPAKVVKAKKQGSNLSVEQQKYWDEIALSIDQARALPLIFLAEKCVSLVPMVF